MLHQESRIWGNIRTVSRIACIEDMKASPLHTLHGEFCNICILLVTSGLLLLPFSPERSPYRELSAQEEHSHPEDPFLSSSEVGDVSVKDHENCDIRVKTE